MKRQKSEARSRKSENTNHKSSYFQNIVIVCILTSVFWSLAAFGSEKWAGVDESVVEKYAKEQGREPRDPIINTDQGDLLLFLFLMAGAVGGFAAGYYWRVLVAEKTPLAKGEQQKV